MTCDLPVVSIVIPAFNHANYLDEAIDSVLAQTYPHVDLIVLDDGSTDNTVNVLRGYTGNLYWESHPNMGQAATLNKGWCLSCGSILGYLSADDILRPDAIERSVRWLLASPCAVLVYCDYDLMGANSQLVRTIRVPDFDYVEMVSKVTCPPGPGALFLRSAADAAGPWNAELRMCPDYDYWLRLGLQGQFIRIPEVLACLRIHDRSLSFSAVKAFASDEYIRVIQAHYERDVLPSAVSLARREALSNAYIIAARSHLRSRRYRIGCHRVVKGLRIYPRNLRPRTLKLLSHGLLNHLRYRNLAVARALPGPSGRNRRRHAPPGPGRA